MIKPRFEASPLVATGDFRKALGKWFSTDGKDYPWRRTRDPYSILVSEMMLQQTRVATVLGKGYYTRFLAEFPDVASLAAADDTRLLKAWEGLGYYRRARMLRSAAAGLLEIHGGVFPSEEKALLALPGIGPYTAAALLSFSFGKPSALVDGNVSRVLARLMDDAETIESSAAVNRHREWALALCDPQNPRIHHYAMMELGQTVCRPGVPLCEMCPVSRFCKTREPEKLPEKKKAPAITEITEHAIWSRDSQGRILLHRETGKRRNGLWKLPLRNADFCAPLALIYEASYPITRYRVLLKVHAAHRPGVEQGEEWIDPLRLESLPLAAPFRKALGRISADF
ncbi:A/G-specific adenine glycosylase [Akkermansiaceae bacterium]|nr:A/G-specific adenine glycosylase [Akkermansiaceae bacterium]